MLYPQQKLVVTQSENRVKPKKVSYAFDLFRKCLDFTFIHNNSYIFANKKTKHSYFLKHVNDNLVST